MPSSKTAHSLRANLAHETAQADRAEAALAAAMPGPSAFTVIKAAVLAGAVDPKWRRELMMALGVVRAGLAPNANDEPEHRVCRHGARPVDDLCEVCDAE